MNEAKRSNAKVIGFGLIIFALLLSVWMVHRLTISYTEPPAALSSPKTFIISTEPAKVGSPREQSEVSGGISDRWFPLVRAVPAISPPPPARDIPEPAPVEPSPEQSREPSAKLVRDGLSAPLSGQVPLPRPRPVLVERADTPLPRPRPGGSAPSSAFDPVDANDDRYPSP